MKIHIEEREKKIHTGLIATLGTRQRDFIPITVRRSVSRVSYTRARHNNKKKIRITYNFRCSFTDACAASRAQTIRLVKCNYFRSPAYNNMSYYVALSFPPSPFSPSLAPLDTCKQQNSLLTRNYSPHLTTIR